jgi:hypothetical protein
MNNKVLAGLVGVVLLLVAMPVPGFVNAQDDFKLPSLWTYDLNSTCISGAAAGDIDNDGKLEIVFGTHQGDGHLYALNAENGSLLWRFLPGGGPLESSVRIHDINNDSQLEIVFAGYDSYIEGTGILYALNGSDGVPLWEYPIGGHSRGGAAIVDIDEDSKLEIIVGMSRNDTGGYVHIVNAEDGSLHHTVGPFDGDIHSSPAVLDLNLDRHLDFVVATQDGDNSMHAIDGTDYSTMWTYQADAGFREGCSFADIDGDAIQELVIGSEDGRIHAVNGEDGSNLWIYEGDSTYYAVTVVDMEPFHGPEIVAISRNMVVVLHSDGEPSWSMSHQSPTLTNSLTTPAVSDLNGNDMVDVCYGDSEGWVEVRDGNSGIIYIFKLNGSIPFNTMGIYHSPIIADLDDDGFLDIFVVGGKSTSVDPEDNYGRAFAFKGTGGTGDGWLTDKHDVRNTGCLDGYSDVVMISGHVEDYYNESAIVGAQVGTRGGNLFVTTDETGNYSLNLYPGVTAITVDAEGYDSAIRTVRILAEEGQVFNFRLVEESNSTAPVFLPPIEETLPTHIIAGIIIEVGIVMATVGAVIIVMAMVKKRYGG